MVIHAKTSQNVKSRAGESLDILAIHAKWSLSLNPRVSRKVGYTGDTRENNVGVNFACHTKDPPS